MASPICLALMGLCVEGESLPLLCCHMTYEQWRQLSHAHNFGTSSPTPLPTVLSLFCCPGKLQDCSPEYFSWWGSVVALLLLCPQGQLSHLPQALMSGRGKPMATFIKEKHLIGVGCIFRDLVYYIQSKTWQSPTS